MSKVFVLGLDGCSSVLINRWKGSLPTFRKLMNNGVYGSLQSTIPPLTCPAWCCMFTGKNPGKLGMYGFIDITNGRVGLHSSQKYSSQAVWEIASVAGKKVGLLNVPMTYPPPVVRGYSVSGFPTPFAETRKNAYTSPISFIDELDNLVGRYEIEPPIDLTIKGKEEQYIKTIEEDLYNKAKVFKHFITEYKWDLLICAFVTLDRIQHYFWHHMDRNHPCHTTEKYQSVIKDFYIKIDGILKNIIDLLPANTNLLITSDHGFTASYGRFFVNRWLEELGLIDFKKSSKPSILRYLRLAFLRISNPSLTRRISEILPQKLLSALLAASDTRIEESILDTISWRKTKAFAIGESGAGANIFINEKALILGEYEKIRNIIIKEIRETTENIVVYKKEDIFNGRYLAKAPDLVLLSDKYALVGNRSNSIWEFPTKSKTGMHAMEGTFVGYGSGFENRGELPQLRIWDVAPTILHLMGLPIPDDLDGKVIN